MQKKTLKSKLMDFCESCGTDQEFTWSQLHEFMVLETLASHPERFKYFDESDIPASFRDLHPRHYGLVALTYKECIQLYFECPRIFRGFMSTPLANPGSYYDWCKMNYMRRPSKNELRYLVKISNGKYKIMQG